MTMMKEKRPNPSAPEGVAAVERALSILTCFQQGDTKLSLAELAKRTGLVKSTIVRLVASLCKFGILMRVDDSGYQLGGEILRLHSIYNDSFDVEGIIVPVLESLARASEETAAFYVERDNRRFCLFRVNSTQALRLDIAPGSYRPMDNASSAQVLRLFRNWPEEQPPVPALPLYTAGATTPHTASLSLPVFGQGQKLVGTVSVSGPASRLTWDSATRIREKIIAAAATMTQGLGGDPKYLRNLAKGG